MATRLDRALNGREQRSALALATLAVVVFALVPLAAPLIELVAGHGELAPLLSSTRLWVLLLRSIGLAAAFTALALAVGVPLGILLSRTDIWGRRIVWLLHAFPMFLPPFLLALGSFHLFGRQGSVGSETSATLLFGPLGVMVVMALALAPIVTTLTALGMMSIDASLEEAALTVAKPWRVVTRILLPSAWPAVALAAIVVFALALSELGVPMFLRVDVYPAAVFARIGGADYAPGEALGLALPLLVIALGLVVIERRVAGGRSFSMLRLRGARAQPIALGRWRGVASAACWLVAGAALLPLIALTARGVTGGGMSELSRWIGRGPENSIVSALSAATIMTAVGLVVGHGMARGGRVAAALDAVTVMLFVTPAPVLGVGLIAAWNRPATQWVYGTLAVVVVGAVARYTVVATRTIAVSVAQSSANLEEAAAATGARYFRRLVRIVLPVHRRGVLAAWLLALVFVLRDLEMAVLYYPPGGEPLTVRIFTLEANGPEAVVAALAVVHVGLTALVVASGGWLLLRRRW